MPGTNLLSDCPADQISSLRAILFSLPDRSEISQIDNVFKLALLAMRQNRNIRMTVNNHNDIAALRTLDASSRPVPYRIFGFIK